MITMNTLLKENTLLKRKIILLERKLEKYNKIIRKLKRIQEEIEAVKAYNNEVSQRGTDRTGYITPEEWERRKEKKRENDS